MASKQNKDGEPTERPTLADPSSSTAQTTGKDSWPRFLVIEATDKNTSISNINPFLRAKALHAILGVEPKAVNFYRNSGLLCVEVDSRSQSNSLLNAKMFHNIPIQVSIHRTKNYTKGVFTCRDLVGMADEDILTEIKDQGVVEVHRIVSKRNGNLVPNHTFRITFNSTTLPKDVKIGYMNVKVRPFIPNPRRCFNCQKYGHSKLRCQGTAVCAKCGQEGHEYETCTNDPHCLHCNGNHPASSQECPVWKREKQIVELVFTQKLTFYEAKQRVQALQPQTNNTKLMSDVVRSTPRIAMKSIATQTEETHCLSCTCQSRSDINIQTDTVQSESEDSMDAESASAKRTISELDGGDTPPSKTKPSAAIAAGSSSERGGGQSRSESPSSVRSRSKSPKPSRPKIIRPLGGESKKGSPSKSKQRKSSGIPQRTTAHTANNSR